MSKSIVVGTTLAVLGLGGMAFGAGRCRRRRRPGSRNMPISPGSSH